VSILREGPLVEGLDQVGDPIEVVSKRDRGAESEPLLVAIEEPLQTMLDRLAGESAPFE